MKTESCPRRAEVLEAFAADGLMGKPALMAHLSDCTACSATIADELVGAQLARALDGLSDAPPQDAPDDDRPPPLTENEAALLLCDWGEAPRAPDEIAEVDQRRLRRVAEVYHASSRRASPPTRRRAPPASTGPRRRRRNWIGGVGVALAIAAAALLWVRRPPPPEAVALDGSTQTIRLPGFGAFSRLVRRGELSEVALDIGSRLCVGTQAEQEQPFPASIGPVAHPCAWNARKDAFGVLYRRQPKSQERYLVVMALDAEGDLTVLYPTEGSGEPLPVTHGRESTRCRRGLCWLDGGMYEVPPGRLVVAGIFSETPLDPKVLGRAWTPEKWAGPGRTLTRFELEVAP